MSEINDYLSKADKDLTKSVMYRVYGMPGPLFMNEDEVTPTPGPEPEPSTDIPFYVENITEETENLIIYIATIPMNIEYSTDNANWYTLPAIDEYTVGMDVNPGDKVYLRTHASYWCSEFGEGVISNQFQGTISKIGGNIMSLFYGDDFTGEETEFPEQEKYTTPLGGVFQSLTSLIDASKLIIPATTMPDGCCYAMFNDCTLLTTAPVLLATTVGYGCCNGMFYHCTSLTTAPALPATTLDYGCYGGMFEGCTSLTTAPVLPATTLTESCYSSMFSGCTSLNEITIYADDISANQCLNGWLSGVAETGTFHNLGTATYEKDSVSGIPEGWTEVHE